MRLFRSRLKNKVILITGGTSGLGFQLMLDLLKEKAKLAICARSEEDLERVKKNYPEVFVYACDVSDEAETRLLIEKTISHFGHLDIVINSAGIILVGPMEGQDHETYKTAMDVMYWGIVNTTLAIVPHMKERGQGQIVNITSVGGKVSIPHLLPYSAAKFAAVGFSEGITIELRPHNIFVTTIIPGLMRTGSYVNALFQKDSKHAFKLFSFISSTPFFTVSNQKASRRIIKALKKKRPVKVIGLQARLLIDLHHFFPNTLSRLFSLTSRLIPSQGDEKRYVEGHNIKEKYSDAEVPGIEKIGHNAIHEYQEQK